ncbi:MAG: four helix bundle protein [Verrucomicrobiota bacterium]
MDHEKLEVYQESPAFVARLEPRLQKLPKSVAVRDQLDRATTSIVLNLAEGNGKLTSPDRGRFLTFRAGRLWRVPRRWMFWSRRAGPV